MLYIFDMGGVITTTFDMKIIYQKLKLSKEQFNEICNFGKINLLAEYEIGTITASYFWEQFYARIGNMQHLDLNGINTLQADLKVITPEVLSEIPEYKYDLFRMCFHPELQKNVVKVLETLKKNNRVVCGTNTNQSHWENHMERGDYSIFHQTYASNKMGVMKPDPEFFRIILESEGYEPQQAFFTDDKLENCNAAASLGINVYHFKSASGLKAAIKKIQK